MTTSITIQFPPTPAGVATAREELAELESLLVDGDRSAPMPKEGTEAEQPEPDASDENDVARRVYNSATDGGRTQDLLKALPRDDEHALTFAELGERMPPWEDGKHLRAAEVRACYRNERRIERTLKKRGVISGGRVVIQMVWDDAESIGRYFLSGPDHDVIKSL